MLVSRSCVGDLYAPLHTVRHDFVSCDIGTHGRSRTDTLLLLREPTLPIGLRGHCSELTVAGYLARRSRACDNLSLTVKTNEPMSAGPSSTGGPIAVYCSLHLMHGLGRNSSSRLNRPSANLGASGRTRTGTPEGTDF